MGWYFPDSLGGTEIYVAAMARRFRQAGLETVVAAPRAGMSGADDEYAHEGTPIYRYGIPSTATRAEARGDHVVRGVAAFHEWLTRQKPDVVHFHTFVTGLGFLEVQAAKRTGARVFVTTHSSALGYVCLRGTLMRWGKTICDGVIRRRTCGACALHARGVPRTAAQVLGALPMAAARRFDEIDHSLGTALGLPAYVEQRLVRQRHLFDAIDRFFVLTDQARTVLLANGAPQSKVVVNRLGIDLNPPFPARSAPVPGKRLVLGFLGRLDPVKGIDDLLAAFEALPPSLPVHLDVRGIADQPGSAAIHARLTAAAATDARVTLGGPVAREDVAALLASWDVLCCPGKSLEGGPTVALEAMAVGTPVIATRMGGIAELVTDGVNGVLIAPGDVPALARVLGRIISQPALLDQWRAALPPVRTMDDVAGDYVREYREYTA